MIRIPLRSQFVGFTEERRPTTGGRSVVDWIARHEAGDVVLPAEAD